MALVIPNVAEEFFLNCITRKIQDPLHSWAIRLYSNNKTPANTDIASDYTAITDGVSVTNGDGTYQYSLSHQNFVTTPGSPTSTLYTVTNPKFLFSQDVTVYGCYVINLAAHSQVTDSLIAAQRLTSAPFTATNGDSITITFTLTLGSVSGD